MKLMTVCRHLVLQGEVSDPKSPASAFDYPSFEALATRVDTVTTMMRNSTTAAMIAAYLAPFFNSKYYYMFDYFNYSFKGAKGAAGYKEYMLAPGGSISNGYQHSVGPIELKMV